MARTTSPRGFNYPEPSTGPGTGEPANVPADLQTLVNGLERYFDEGLPAELPDVTSPIGAALRATIASRMTGALVDAFGADPTGATDSTAAFVAALASMPTTVVHNGTASKTYPVGRLMLGHGKYRLDGDVGNVGPWVDVLGPGHNSCTLDYRGNGSCIRAWNEVDPRYPSNTFDVMFDQDKPHGIGGRFNGYTIDGTNAGAGAKGLHVGDFEGGNLGPELFIKHFNKTGSVGIHFDNRISWSENWRGSASLLDCKTHVLFSKSSMSYNHLDFKIYARHNQDGIVFTEGAAYYNGTLKATANFEVAPTGTTNNAAYLTIGTGQDDPGVPSHVGSWLKNTHLTLQGECVRTEVSTQSAAVPAGCPTTVRFGDLTKDKLDGCTGIMSFGGQTWKQSNWVSSLDNHLSFDGVIAGDQTLNPGVPFMTNPFPVRAPILPVSTVPRTLKRGHYYSASSTIDLQSGDYFDLGELAADVTLIFGNPIANAPRRILIRAQQGSLFRNITWPSATSPSISAPVVYWEGGVPPMLTRVGGAIDAFELWTIDGARWHGRQRPAFALPPRLPVAAYRGRAAASTATVNVTPSGEVPVGQTLVAFVATTAAGATATPTVTDAKGNTWTVDATTGTDGARVWVARAVVTSALATTDAVTVTWSAAVASHVTLIAVTNLGAAPKLDRVATVDQAAASAFVEIAPPGPTRRPAQIALAFVATSGGGTQWTASGDNPVPLGAWSQSTAGATSETGQAAWLSLPGAGIEPQVRLTPAAARRSTAVLVIYSA
ncbi:hypothetical protein ACOACO_17390 [Nocardioides sp. CPCC 205120]|uniref:hypothetical protein n=1 Tax=Nocardioides sp. CPCC 205120 TaxID=3406462 RepID=UPI003B50AE33